LTAYDRSFFILHPGVIRWCFAISIALCITSCGTIPKTSVTAQPEGRPLSSVNDSLYAHVLDRAMSPTGAISFTRLEGDTELTDYLEQIAQAKPEVFLSRWQLLAFWINAHNAFALDLIRSNMPVHSISDIGGFRYAHVLMVGGTLYSLDDIEHVIIGKQFREPRAFFALYDGSRSSPALKHTPYSEAHLSEELDKQLKTFLADSSKNYLDPHSNTLYLSEVFNDYAANLEDAAGGSLLEFVKAFAPPKMAEWLGRHPNVRISYLSYDNTLNSSDIEQPHEPPTHERKQTSRRSSGGIR